MPQQPWTDEVWEDSDGGRVVLHGTLPTVVYPNAMRPRLAFHGLALLESPDVVDLWVQEEKDEAESQGVNLEAIPASLPSGSAEYDARLGCTTLTDTRHSLTVQVWPNGKCIVADARHPNMVAMSAVYWNGVFSDQGIFVDRI